MGWFDWLYKSAEDELYEKDDHTRKWQEILKNRCDRVEDAIVHLREAEENGFDWTLTVTAKLKD